MADVKAIVERLDKYIADYIDAPSWGGPTLYPAPPTFNDIREIRDTIEALQAKVEQLEGENGRHEAAWNDMLALLEDAPEINPSNYDHDQVCLLNSQMIQAWQLANEMHSGETRQALGEQP